MQNVTRCVLPGYNAQTDTNPDHFSLYSDVDNVLIKRLLTGSAVIADGNPTIYTIPHNLGYIPFFMVYCDNASNGIWEIVNNLYNPFQVPQEIAFADTTNLYIYNFGGHASGNAPFAWDIFYDDMSLSGTPSIVESEKVFKVARPGKNALTSKNPNDYIVHSDLNNFKILAQGQATIDCNGLSTVTIPHGANVQAPYKYFLFIKSPFDNETVLCGGAAETRVFNDNEFTQWYGSSMDATNIYVYKDLANIQELFTFKWYIYGSGKANTIITSSSELAVAAPGKNVLTETNPDNFNFHSAYQTLKYFQEGSYSMTVSNSTTHTIPHNLGYIPFFIGFVSDISGFSPGASNNYCIMPYYWGRSSIANPSQNIGAFMFADATNIYLKAYFQATSGNPTITFNFYYKIFKNNTGL